VVPNGVNASGVNTTAANANAPAASAVRPPAPRPLTPEQQKAADAARFQQQQAANRPPAQARTTPAAQTPIRIPQPTVSDETISLQLYFAGDYSGAFVSFTKLAEDPTASRRTYLFLACSRAAMVLVGQAPRPAMAEARQFLAEAGSLQQFQRELAFISPRIRQELGIQQ
jgi:hypothetical protein